jgi:alpha-1,6-mannosyltransferase
MTDSVRVQRPVASAADPPADPSVRRLGWIAVIGIGGAIATMIGASFVRQDWMYPALRSPVVGPPFELHARVSGTLVSVGLWAAALLGLVGVAAGLLAARRGAHGPIRLMLIGGALATVALMMLPPAGSTDALDYAAYGRLALFGHNPYVATPLYVRITDPAFAQSIPTRWQLQVSPYGPGATIEQYLAARLGGDSIARVVFWLKMWNALAFGAAAFVLDRVLRGRPAARLRAHLLWTINPLLLWVLVAAGHVDVVAAAAGLIGLLAIGRQSASVHPPLWRAVTAGMLVGIAADIKIDFALFGLGLAWALRRSAPALLAAVGGALVILVPTYAWLGRPAVDALFARSDKTSQDSFYRFADLTNWRFLIVLALALFLGIAILLLQRLPLGDKLRPAIRSTLAVSVAWLIIWPYQLPWYDAMIFCVLALYPASTLDWVLLARLGAATIGTMPGNPNGVPGTALRSTDVLLVHALVPVVLLACAAGILVLAISGQWGVRADRGTPKALGDTAADPGTLPKVGYPAAAANVGSYASACPAAVGW